jgi:hypothetical protein
MYKPNINTKKFKNGLFKPKNPQKYIGELNNIIYRSSYEYKFMVYCDMNINILKWSSEPIAIPYISILDNKVHKYFIDFWIETKDKKILVEIKPYKQTLKPILKENYNYTRKQIENYNYELKEYMLNLSKWKAAKEFAASKNFDFWIITENELKKLFNNNIH